jgi:hypothetical protein
VVLVLVAGIFVTAAGEWELARQVGISRTVAPLLAVVIDAYVIAAVRARRGWDVASALAMMGGAQVAAHLLRTGHIGPSVGLVAAVSLVAPTVIWRVHALAGSDVRPTVTVPETEPPMNVTRTGDAPWKPPTPKWAPALPPPAPKAVSAALTAGPETVTARVQEEPEKAPESPQRARADEVVRGLYDRLGGKRPGTRHIRQALADAGLPNSDGTARSVRLRVEQEEPLLKVLPPA